WLVSLVGLLHGDPRSTRNPAYRIVRLAVFPDRLPDAVLWASLLALLAGLFALVALARGRRERGGPLPLPVFWIVATQVIWFTWGIVDPFFNAILVPILHALQYLALTTWHHLKSRPVAIRRGVIVYGLTIIAIGVVINPGLNAFTLLANSAGG